jgi:hypothetical protein
MARRRLELVDRGTLRLLWGAGTLGLELRRARPAVSDCRVERCGGAAARFRRRWARLRAASDLTGSAAALARVLGVPLAGE